MESSNLRKQIDDLTSKTQINEYTIKAKLQEKDDALVTVSDQVMKLMAEEQQFKRNSTLTADKFGTAMPVFLAMIFF